MLKRRGGRTEAGRQRSEETLQIVAFRVGAELYGLDIMNIREIDVMHPITKVPKAVSFVEGVIHLREMIIPVIDLARRFGLPPIVPDRHTRVIVTNLHGRGVGLIVTSVSEVLPLRVKDIGPPPPLTFDQTTRFISGMARLPDGLISIINLDRLLSNEEVEQLQQQPTLF